MVETRDRILRGAVKAFHANGLASSTMAEIADRAGIGRATLYRHFGSKDEILQALVLREARDLFDQLEQVAFQEDSPNGMLDTMLPVAFDFLRGHRLLQRVFRNEPELAIPYLTNKSSGLLTAAIDFLEPFFERAKKAGRLDVDAKLTAEWACRIIFSLLTTPSVVADLSDHAQLKRYLAPVIWAFGGKAE